jgi:hypothetical protein
VSHFEPSAAIALVSGMMWVETENNVEHPIYPKAFVAAFILVVVRIVGLGYFYEEEDVYKERK